MKAIADDLNRLHTEWLIRQCEDCRSDDVFTVRPGSQSKVVAGGITINRGARDQAWCKRCAARRGWIILP